MRKRTLVGLLAAVGLVAVAILVLSQVSTGGGDGQTSSASTTGRLSADPEPLSLADVAKQPDPAARTVLRLWFYGQWGSQANLLSLINPTVRRIVGDGILTNAYSVQRLTFVSSRPKITGIEKTSLGRVVRVATLTKTGPPQLDSFLMKQIKGRWVDMYDTVTDRILQAYGQQLKQPLVPGSAKTPTEKVVRAGQALAASFRKAGVSTSLDGTTRGSLKPSRPETRRPVARPPAPSGAATTPSGPASAP